MKFTPRLPKENVNISKKLPLLEFLKLSLGCIILISAVYFLLGLASEILIEKFPERIDRVFERLSAKMYTGKSGYPCVEKELQILLDNLTYYLPKSNHSFSIHVVDNKQENALALPGGHIVVYTGLIDSVQSENEISFILAHELGHFAHHDHLRALGRGVVLVMLSVTVFGSDSSVTSYFNRLIAVQELRYSRRQELAADAFALNLLYKCYGHVSGALDLFLRDNSLTLPILSSHPIANQRIMEIRRLANELYYPQGPTVPLSACLKKFAVE